MTKNKRFTVPIKYRLSHSKIQLNGTPLTNDELIRILNTNDGAFIQNFALKRENKELKNENVKLKQTINEMIDIFYDSGLDYIISDELED